MFSLPYTYTPNPAMSKAELDRLAEQHAQQHFDGLHKDMLTPVLRDQIERLHKQAYLDYTFWDDQRSAQDPEFTKIYFDETYYNTLWGLFVKAGVQQDS